MNWGYTEELTVGKKKRQFLWVKSAVFVFVSLRSCFNFVLQVSLQALKSNWHTRWLILLPTPKHLLWQTLPLKASDTNVPIASVGITFLFWMCTRAWQLADGLCSEPTPPVSVWHLGLRDVTDGFLPISITVHRAHAPFCTKGAEQPLSPFHKHSYCAWKTNLTQKNEIAKRA